MPANNPNPPPARWDGDGESLWELASGRGMGRRQFLQLMVAGGAAAVLAACFGTDIPVGTPTPPDVASSPYHPWFKDPGSIH